jgi:hypothetical protein
VSRLEAIVIVALTLVLGGVPLALRADGLGAGDPGLGQVYRLAGIGLTAAGVPALWLAVWRGPPTSGGGAGRRLR